MVVTIATNVAKDSGKFCWRLRSDTSRLTCELEAHDNVFFLNNNSKTSGKQSAE